MIDFPPDTAESDDEIDDCPVLHLIVPAHGLPIPATKAQRSVFEFVPTTKLKRQDKTKEPVSPCYSGRVSVTFEGGMQVVGMAYPSARWTQERADREQARRARQRPPKPTKAAKTTSKKLSRLLGDIGDDSE